MRRAGIALAVLLAAVPAAAGASDRPRLVGLDPLFAVVFAEPGQLLAGDRVVAAGRSDVEGWPLSGGRRQSLAPLPPLAPDEGYVAVAAAGAGRIALAAFVGGAFSAHAPPGPGHHVLTGPPAGPFADPAGCGERSVVPAAVAGDLIAYAATPAATPPCPQGTAPAIERPSLVVRDLAAGGAVRAVIPLRFAGAAVALRLAPGHLAAVVLDRPPDDSNAEDDPRPRAVLWDLATGAERFRSAPLHFPALDLDADGTLVFGNLHFSGRRPACVPRMTGLTAVSPQGAARRLPYRPCGDVALNGGRLLHVRERADGYGELVAGDAAGGPVRPLALLTGRIADADAAHALVTERDCRRNTVRVVDLAAPGALVAPAPRRCPVRVQVRRRIRAVRGAKVRLSIRCPRGCAGKVRMRLNRRGDEFTFGNEQELSLPAGGRFVRRYRLTQSGAPSRRPARMTFDVSASNPAAVPTVIHRRVRILPTGR